MQLVESFTRLLSRFRYPVSLPEDLAKDLGMRLSNRVTFSQLLSALNSSDLRCSRLKRYMDRENAEKIFHSALKKESFKSSSLFSYYFNKSWLVFALYFDECDRLCRIYVQCPSCSQMEGFDLHLEEESSFRLTGTI
ncbi:MAG: hypothetical protein S4CHLAM81_01650 [Chlamydiales bacterium]|nr:hypothetical protein [Chlamydiales bacterium]MCH9634961.1 hypothetical protein [Chlamydiales bacterium]MCH9704420.1 hypothetical protein [Chlamydiota bacterium]